MRHWRHPSDNKLKVKKKRKRHLNKQPELNPLDKWLIYCHLSAQPIYINISNPSFHSISFSNVSPAKTTLLNTCTHNSQLVFAVANSNILSSVHMPSTLRLSVTLTLTSFLYFLLSFFLSIGPCVQFIPFEIPLSHKSIANCELRMAPVDKKKNGKEEKPFDLVSMHLNYYSMDSMECPMGTGRQTKNKISMV